MKLLHNINVLGRELQVRSSATPDEVAAMQDLVNRKISEVKAAIGDADTQIVAILVLMNMAEAYFAIKKEVALPLEGTNSRIAKIISRIDETVG